MDLSPPSHSSRRSLRWGKASRKRSRASPPSHSLTRENSGGEGPEKRQLLAGLPLFPLLSSLTSTHPRTKRRFTNLETFQEGSPSFEESSERDTQPSSSPIPLPSPKVRTFRDFSAPFPREIAKRRKKGAIFSSFYERLKRTDPFTLDLSLFAFLRNLFIKDPPEEEKFSQSFPPYALLRNPFSFPFLFLKIEKGGVGS